MRDGLQCAVHSMRLKDSHFGCVHLKLGETLPLIPDLTMVQYLLATLEGVDLESMQMVEEVQEEQLSWRNLAEVFLAGDIDDEI